MLNSIKKFFSNIKQGGQDNDSGEGVLENQDIVMQERAAGQRPRTWIGVDLDGTLAHHDSSSSLFKALFFAGPLDKPLRNQLSALGINHLLAISGFHLGVLGFILFFIVSSLYRPIQGRFFPYRNAHRDVSVLVLVVLFAYLYFLDFVPSLLRAFAMSVFAYILYDRGMKILSFSILSDLVMFT